MELVIVYERKLAVFGKLFQIGEKKLKGWLAAVARLWMGYQPPEKQRVHLFFAMISRDRMLDARLCC